LALNLDPDVLYSKVTGKAITEAAPYTKSRVNLDSDGGAIAQWISWLAEATNG